MLNFFPMSCTFPIFQGGDFFLLTPNFDALFFIFVIPLISLFFLRVFSYRNNSFIYVFSLYSSGLTFILSLMLWGELSSRKGGFQETFQFNMLPSFGFSLRFGVDGISIFFIMLTNLFIFLCILSLNESTPRLVEALIHLIFLQWSVQASFLFLDLLGFFIFFERTLVPIYFLVLLWGSRERRVRASYRMSIYTLLGSMFRFFNILYIYSKTGTTDYELLLQLVFNDTDQRFLWMTFFLAFAAKIPLFPLHIWLPEAHVEAPTIGSVLLAVLLLKMGTYGIVRFSLPLFPEGTAYFSPLVSTFALLGVMYTCFTAIRQIDLKKIIAYSSVGHRNVVLLGMRANTSEALQGAIFQRLSHGVVSGALFFSVGSLYERYSVRSLKYFGGLAHFYPIFTRMFLLFSLANISFPLTSSFVGEFLIFLGLFREHFWATFFAAFSRVLGAVYTLWTFNRIFFGNIRVFSVTAYKDLDRKEFILFFFLVVSLFIRGLFPYFFLDTFLVDVVNILEHSKRLNINLFACILDALQKLFFIFNFFFIKRINCSMSSSFSVNAFSFTFRELRRFRSFYLSRNLLSTEGNDARAIDINSNFVKNNFIRYSFYGNADAISPQQRRQFRGELFRRKDTVNLFNNTSALTQMSWEQGFNQNAFNSEKTTFFDVTRKISVFSIKRAKRVFSISFLNKFRSSLQGSVLYTTFSFTHFDRSTNNKIKADISPLEFSFHTSKFAALSAIKVFSSDIVPRYTPTFISVKDSLPLSQYAFFAVSYDCWKNNLDGAKQIISLPEICFSHLSFLHSILNFFTVVYPLPCIIEFKK